MTKHCLACGAAIDRRRNGLLRADYATVKYCSIACFFAGRGPSYRFDRKPRNIQLLLCWEGGMKKADIARLFHLSFTRTCDILAEWRKRGRTRR